LGTESFLFLVKTFYGDHNNPKKQNILVKNLFLRSHYKFGNVLFWSFGHRFFVPHKLFCSPTDMNMAG